MHCYPLHNNAQGKPRGTPKSLSEPFVLNMVEKDSLLESDKILKINKNGQSQTTFILLNLLGSVKAFS